MVHEVHNSITQMFPASVKIFEMTFSIKCIRYKYERAPIYNHKVVILTRHSGIKKTSGWSPDEGTAHNQHMHHMRKLKDLVRHHMHKHHSLVRMHNKHSVDLDQPDPSHQQHPTVYKDGQVSLKRCLSQFHHVQHAQMSYWYTQWSKLDNLFCRWTPSPRKPDNLLTNNSTLHPLDWFFRWRPVQVNSKEAKCLWGKDV